METHATSPELSQAGALQEGGGEGNRKIRLKLSPPPPCPPRAREGELGEQRSSCSELEQEAGRDLWLQGGPRELEQRTGRRNAGHGWGQVSGKGQPRDHSAETASWSTWDTVLGPWGTRGSCGLAMGSLNLCKSKRC